MCLEIQNQFYQSAKIIFLHVFFVQKYLQQLWNTVVLVALVLSTGVIVHARWQYRDNQFNDDLEVSTVFVTDSVWR